MTWWPDRQPAEDPAPQSPGLCPQSPCGLMGCCAEACSREGCEVTALAFTWGLGAGSCPPGSPGPFPSLRLPLSSQLSASGGFSDPPRPQCQ